jgi:hypothetical protein
MGYRVMNSVDNMREKYGARVGLEGPFNYDGRVLYYDPKEGAYYDPTTDFYVENAEVDRLQNRLMEVMRAGV